MKKLALVFTFTMLWGLRVVHAADFFCGSGNVTCLIAAINTSNLRCRSAYDLFRARNLHAHGGG
jgi:hypothetical protein